MAAAVRRNVWLVTGASGGFGSRFVKLALSKGDFVIAAARSPDKMDTALSTVGGVIPSDRTRLQVVQMDVTDGEDKIRQTVGDAAERHGRIDVVINNAGFPFLGLFEEGGSKVFRKQFDVNFFGPIDVTNACLPFLRKSESGRIVFIGSRSAWRGEVPGLGSYAASKAGINAITETLMTELAPFGIKTMVVHPGSFKTGNCISMPYYTSNSMPIYDSVRQGSQEIFQQLSVSEPGDPDKLVRVVADVVRGEGVAKGREWPTYLFLGDDSIDPVRYKLDTLMKATNDWEEVGRRMRLDRPGDTPVLNSKVDV